MRIKLKETVFNLLKTGKHKTGRDTQEHNIDVNTGRWTVENTGYKHTGQNKIINQTQVELN